MGKKSVKENKNIYQITRENLELTRDEASELMGYISADRIEKIENDRTNVHPDDVLAMSKAYKVPHLCNHFCAHECSIGREYIAPVEEKEFSRIVLEMISALNHIDKEKERLTDIAADDKLSEDEFEDFKAIKIELAKISSSIMSLQLWVDKMIAEGLIDQNLH